MTALRWLTFLLALECLYCLWLSEPGREATLNAVCFLLYFTLYCWTLRRPRPRKADHDH